MRRALLAVASLALATACGSTVQSTATANLGSGGGDGLGGTTTGQVANGSTGITGDPSTTSTTGALTSSTTSSSSGTTGQIASGSTGTRSTGGRGTTPIAPIATGPIPARGPGWDAKYVYIGVTTQKDVQSAFSSVGYNGLDAGDQEGQANSVASYVNQHGGLFGRQVRIVLKDESTLGTASDPSSAGAATCSYFTTDHPVIAVLNPVTLMDVDSFRSCLAHAHIPLFSASVAAVDSKVAASYAPYFYQSVAPTWDALAGPFVHVLQGESYFSGWNASLGKPAAGKAKVGIITPDSPTGARVATLLSNALQAAGTGRPEVFKYDPNNNNTMQSAVLQFNSAGVTHVIETDSGLSAFLTAANTQGYKPRYGVNTLNSPETLLGTSAASQKAGSVGAGWSPAFDTDDAHDPGAINGGVTLCNSIMKAGGQNLTGKRLARAVAYAFCDGIRLISGSAIAGGGLTGPAIYQGVQKIGPTFLTAFSFSSGLGPNRLFVPGAIRPLAYQAGCQCYAYSSKSSTAL